MPHPGGQLGDGQGGGVGADHDVWTGDGLDRSQHLGLDGGDLQHGLLDEVGPGYGG